MGNTNEPKKSSKLNKTQMQVACTKAKIHLEMMRDRKNAEIIRGQRQLVAKLKSNNRNKVEELLIAERVTNALKYAQACNQLASYAASLKSQVHYISENVNNLPKIQPWMMHIYTLEFAAEHMGISSLNQYKTVMRSLYSPLSVQKYCSKDIVQLLSPTPCPQEINIYIVEMSERNDIPLQEINIIGHKFTKQWKEVPVELDQQFLEMKKQLADKMGQNFINGSQGGNNNGQGGDFPNNGGNQGGNFPGNKGGMGGQNGMGGQGGQGGQGNNFNPQNNNQQPVYINPGYNQNVHDSNPYKGLSNVKSGPQYYQPADIKSQIKEKPKQFSSFDDMLKMNQQNNHKLTIYPDVDPKQYKGSEYKPQAVTPVHNPFTPPEQQQEHNSPSLSQIMRDFEKKE